MELKQRGQLRSPASVAQVLYGLCDCGINGKVENGRRYNVDEYDRSGGIADGAWWKARIYSLAIAAQVYYNASFYAQNSTMTLAANHIELLAPAKTIEIGKEAILHGADAVYIGGPGFGARHNASNELGEIAQLVDFAHRYQAKIFVTMNTILHDAELESAAKQVRQLYEAGVDALIVQDMALLEMDLPPIQLHASTQCDIRTVEKAAFLADAGFSQLVLARELTLKQIAAIREKVDTPLEYFVHGALCVAFSGQCYISHAHNGRSANRGDCSQACRLPYTLTDGEGRVVAYEKHLLSMKDNDQSQNLEA